MKTKSREIMSSRHDFEIGHHEKIKSSRERNLAKSCHHEILVSLYNMLMPNDRSRSAACHREARTVFTGLARASRWHAADAVVTAASAAYSLL